MKKCKVCKTAFKPASSLHTVCGHECAVKQQEIRREKNKKLAIATEKRETKQKLEKLKSKAQWAREAQSAFNAWVRERDYDKPCISCGRHHQGQYHAGHYLSVGARPELRFTEINVQKQCAPCNTHLSGNIARYRIALVDRIGLDAVEWLEGPHEPRKDTIDTLAAIKREYAARARKLKGERNDSHT